MPLDLKSIDPLKALKEFVYVDSFPPPGDFHSATTKIAYGDKVEKAYRGLPIETDEGKTIEGKEAKIYFKEKLRSKGKTVGLAYVYGATDYSVKRSLGCDDEEAQRITHAYFTRLPKVKKYIDQTTVSSNKFGKVQNLFNKTLYTPYLKRKINNLWDLPPDERKKHFQKKSAIEREAANFRIQGTAADQLKLILLSLAKFCEKYNLNRVANNNWVNYRNYYTHIVTIEENDLTPEIESKLNSFPDGNIKVLIVDSKNKPIQASNRNLSMTVKDINEVGAKIVW